MDRYRLRRGITHAVIFCVISVVAYLGGIEAAEGLQGWKAKQRKAEQTETLLKEMGTGLGIGKSLPDVVLADLEGIDTRLSDLLCDRTVIVFFRTDCSFSRAELTALKEATTTPEDQRCFVLISNSDQAELWDIKQKLGPSCPILYDRDTQYGRQLGVKTAPLNFVVDRTLKIADVVSGALTGKEIKDFMADNRKK